MKKLLIILFIFSAFNSKATIHQIEVWSGYYQFLPSNNIIVQLGDTIQWIPLDPPTMSHTITSANIPVGAIASVRSRAYDVFQEAEVLPLVDLDSVEIVMIITDFTPTDLNPLLSTPIPDDL